MNELQTYTNNLQVQEIKLDKAIQNFLERRSYENYDIKKVDIETNEDIDFVKISHISYDRNQSQVDLNLIDFQQLLSAVASKSKKIVYMIESSEDGIDLYLGTHSKNGDFLKDFPKGMEFVDIARKEVVDAVHKLNSRPRKCLNYATPYEVFKELTGIDAIMLVKGIRL